MAVQKVTDADFTQHITNHSRVVVKYYADWCGSCRLFAPKFNRLSADARFADVTFLDVNAETSPDARKAAGVTNLPYFAVFKDGKLLEAIASSKEESVVELLNKLN
jgi:thiol-disulfide isomerase/thioredoxin